MKKTAGQTKAQGAEQTMNQNENQQRATEPNAKHRMLARAWRDMKVGDEVQVGEFIHTVAEKSDTSIKTKGGQTFTVAQVYGVEVARLVSAGEPTKADKLPDESAMESAGALATPEGDEGVLAPT